jgi:large conductance mechanosensitive channel
MKKIAKELKEFMFRGNVVDMAVGVVIGVAFGAIINSLVNDLLMPIISLITGKIDFTNLFIALDGGKYPTLAAAESAGASLLKYGSFITAVINFVLIATVIFFFIKMVNRFRTPAPEKPQPRLCPFCFGELHEQAVRCPHCTSEVPMPVK